VARVQDHGDHTLAHYGIPGMRWGKRKSNTASPSSMSTKTPFEKNPNKAPPPAKGVTDLTPKNIKRISDTELRARINRIQMETQYSQLVNGTSKAENTGFLAKAGNAHAKFEKGHKVVNNILAVVGTAQKIYKLANSDMVRAARGLPPADKKKKNDD